MEFCTVGTEFVTLVIEKKLVEKIYTRYIFNRNVVVNFIDNFFFVLD